MEELLVNCLVESSALTEVRSDALLEFIFPAAHPLLHQPTVLNAYLLGAKSLLGGRLVAFILAEVYPHNNTVQLYSFYVDPAYRKQGIGRSLFLFFQDVLLHQKKVGSIGCEFDQSLPECAAFEKILLAAGWPQPYFYLLRCFFDMSQFNPPWFGKKLLLPAEVEIFPWEQLTEKDKKNIKNKQAQGWFHSYLNPFQGKIPIEELNSLGMRFQGNLIGWCITHRVEKDLIRYTSLYTDPVFQGRAWGIALLQKSLEIQIEKSQTWALFDAQVKEIDPTWVQFIKKRLLPYAQKVERKKWVQLYTHSSGILDCQNIL